MIHICMEAVGRHASAECMELAVESRRLPAPTSADRANTAGVHPETELHRPTCSFYTPCLLGPCLPKPTTADEGGGETDSVDIHLQLYDSLPTQAGQRSWLCVSIARLHAHVRPAPRPYPTHRR